jgi:hypothetical protein
MSVSKSITKVFTEDNISMGFADEWQKVVDSISKIIRGDDEEEDRDIYVIITTGVVEHNINISAREICTAVYGECSSKKYQKAVQKLSLISCHIKDLTDAILAFQKNKIVQEASDTRSFMGPMIDSYEWAHSDELHVLLCWDS